MLASLESVESLPRRLFYLIISNKIHLTKTLRENFSKFLILCGYSWYVTRVALSIDQKCASRYREETGRLAVSEVEYCLVDCELG